LNPFGSAAKTKNCPVSSPLQKRCEVRVLATEKKRGQVRKKRGQVRILATDAS
jgi:hypothetical protein